MKTLSVSDLAAFLSGLKGATFATITTDTDARVRVACPFGRNVRKVSRVNVTLGHNYTNAVNRQRVREESTPDFQAAPRQWGERIPGTTLVRHPSGKLYLETKVEKSLGCEYRDTAGNLLDSEAVKPFLPKRGETRQDVEKEIIVRDYALDSIRHVKVAGEEFLIV